MSTANPNSGGWRKRGAHTPVGNKSSNTRAGSSRQRQQQHLLDVRVRTREISRHRRASLIYWLSAALLLAIIGGAIYLGATRGLARLFYQNPDYNITTLQVETDGVLTRDQVLDSAGLREGMNIFHVNLDQARERLETLPLVQKAQVQRHLPNKVAIILVERRPIAWVAPEQTAVPGKPVTPLTREEIFSSKDTFLVDGIGTLLRPKKLIAQNFDLPIIRGCATGKLAPGQAVDSDEMRAALDLIRAHQDSLLGARFQIQDIDISKGYGITVTDRRNTQVFFALEEIELQLKTLETLLRTVDATGKRPATISLATVAGRQRNIPVTFQTDPPPGQVLALASPAGGAQPAAVGPPDAKAKGSADSAAPSSAPPPPPAPAASAPASKPPAAPPTRTASARSTERRVPTRTARAEKPSPPAKPREEVGGFRGGRTATAPAPTREPMVMKAQPVQ